jgi:signal transduction histidine kinase
LAIIGGVFAGVGRQLQKENVQGLEGMIERGMRSLKRLFDLQVKVDDILSQKPSKEKDGTLRLIENALGLVEELKEDERMGESARAALELFSRRLESVYKTESIRWEKIDAAELVREVVQEAGPFMGGRDVEIQTDVHAGLALEMDRSNLKKVCRGLLRNAIENTPDEGKVEIQAVSREKSIHLSFRDYGIGITEQNRKMIFGGFFHNRDPAMYSSKNRYQFNAGGTGVDLLRTKVFSERYKFQVGFESRRCRFLPRDEDACPGRISKCSFVKDRGECFSSGGSTFSLAFPRSGAFDPFDRTGAAPDTPVETRK